MRRNRHDLLSPPELAIVKAIELIEALGAAESLTYAVNHLQTARDHIAIYIREIDAED